MARSNIFYHKKQVLMSHEQIFLVMYFTNTAKFEQYQTYVRFTQNYSVEVRSWYLKVCFSCAQQLYCLKF